MAAEIGKLDINYHLISILVVQHEKPNKVVIPAIEKHLYFPDMPGIEDVTPVLIDEYFGACLEGVRISDCENLMRIIHL
jgi:hypothetical protein